MKKIWISWEHHRRTSEIVAEMKDVQLFVLEMNAARSIRYPVLLLKTIGILLKQRPDLVMIQSPSLVLALFMVTIGRLLVKNVVVDAHNEGLRPFYRSLHWLMPMYAYIQRRSRLTIVTNESLAREVKNNGGRPFVLEDKIPIIEECRKVPLNENSSVVFICTFERDEPFMEVIQSGAFLYKNICIHITGRYSKLPQAIVRSAPPNIHFTGFLSDQNYKNLLNSCDAVMDLTLMEDCLVCGAYEAVALEKPMILTDTKALRTYFYRGAVYTENRPREIAAAVHKVMERKGVLKKEVAFLKRDLQEKWQNKFNKLTYLMDSF